MCFLTAKNKVEIAIHVINLRFFEVKTIKQGIEKWLKKLRASCLFWTDT